MKFQKQNKHAAKGQKPASEPETPVEAGPESATRVRSEGTPQTASPRSAATVQDRPQPQSVRSAGNPQTTRS